MDCPIVEDLSRIRYELERFMLGGAFEFFEEQKIYLVSQAANDLNFTFVVDESQGDRLVEQLHELLIRPVRGDRVLGPTWEQLFSQPQRAAVRASPWRRQKRDQLIAGVQLYQAAGAGWPGAED